MTQAPHQRQTRIVSPTILSTNRQVDRVDRDDLACRCRVVFDRLYPQLIESYSNWHIAIDPNTELYLLAPTLTEITKQIKDAYGDCSVVKLTIFRLNKTGTCGHL